MYITRVDRLYVRLRYFTFPRFPLYILKKQSHPPPAPGSGLRGLNPLDRWLYSEFPRSRERGTRYSTVSPLLLSFFAFQFALKL